MGPEIDAMHFKYVTLLSVDVVCIGLIFLNSFFFIVEIRLSARRRASAPPRSESNLPYFLIIFVCLGIFHFLSHQKCRLGLALKNRLHVLAPDEGYQEYWYLINKLR